MLSTDNTHENPAEVKIQTSRQIYFQSLLALASEDPRAFEKLSTTKLLQCILESPCFSNVSKEELRSSELLGYNLLGQFDTFAGPKTLKWHLSVPEIWAQTFVVLHFAFAKGNTTKRNELIESIFPPSIANSNAMKTLTAVFDNPLLPDFIAAITVTPSKTHPKFSFYADPHFSSEYIQRSACKYINTFAKDAFRGVASDQQLLASQRFASLLRTRASALGQSEQQLFKLESFALQSTLLSRVNFADAFRNEPVILDNAWIFAHNIYCDRYTGSGPMQSVSEHTLQYLGIYSGGGSLRFNRTLERALLGLQQITEREDAHPLHPSVLRRLTYFNNPEVMSLVEEDPFRGSDSMTREARNILEQLPASERSTAFRALISKSDRLLERQHATKRKVKKIISGLVKDAYDGAFGEGDLALAKAAQGHTFTEGKALQSEKPLTSSWFWIRTVSREKILLGRGNVTFDFTELSHNGLKSAHGYLASPLMRRNSVSSRLEASQMREGALVTIGTIPEDEQTKTLTRVLAKSVLLDECKDLANIFSTQKIEEVSPLGASIILRGNREGYDPPLEYVVKVASNRWCYITTKILSEPNEEMYGGEVQLRVRGVSTLQGVLDAEKQSVASPEDIVFLRGIKSFGLYSVAITSEVQDTRSSKEP